MTAPTTNGRYALPRPFLKWVGGKTQLLPELMKRVEMAGDFGRYHEPFLGGGALFFELYRAKKLPKSVFLADGNLNLVTTYRGVRDRVQEVIGVLRSHQAKHSEDYYYQVRDMQPREAHTQAARVIYLNKTGFNGLYRENRRGQFNVPFGRYKNPTICDEDNLREVSKALRRADIDCNHFVMVYSVAQKGDLVYFDPPYHPVSKTSSFTGYKAGGFDEYLQQMLAVLCRGLDKKGVKFILSNSHTPLILKLYKDFTVEKVLAKRLINSKKELRGEVSEALIRNF